MTGPESNRRGHERVAATVRLIVKKFQDETPLVISESESLDVSESGILLNSDIFLPEDLEVLVELHLSESLHYNANWPTIKKDFPRDIVMQARVVRSHGAREIGYEVAMQFSEADHKKLQILSDFLKQVESH